MKSETIRRILIAGMSASTWLALVSSPAAAQSFDCRKATTAIEKMICADADLSALDEQMARAFTDARKGVDASAIGQVAWLRNIRNRCATVDCLKGAYTERIAYLRNVSPDGALSLDGLAGEWTWLEGTQFGESSLTIENVTSAGFNFDISASSGAHTGQIEGTAVKNGAQAIFTDDEVKCEVRFSRKGDRLLVSTSSECSRMGGMGVMFAGEYAKGNLAPRTATLTELGVLASNVTEQAFAALVGNDYQLFVSSFQLRSDDDDQDGLGTKVASGSVRGLSTFMEAIVMSRADGTILAAVIDDDVVKYFSNDAAFKTKLPKTIDAWRERFAAKKVILPLVK